jgi:hypothetical protein
MWFRFRQVVVAGCASIASSTSLASNMGSRSDWFTLFFLAGFAASIVIVSVSSLIFLLLLRKRLARLRWLALVTPALAATFWLQRMVPIVGGDSLSSLSFVLLPMVLGFVPAFGLY